MALGALIGAYQEDDSGSLRALLPLAGRTLIEFQLRCLAAIDASPLVVMVERVPPALNEAFERLRSEGINVIPVSDGLEAASRFEAGADIILLSDGIVPDMADLSIVSEETAPLILTVPDNDEYRGYERIDAQHRWSGLALIDGGLIGATAAMLGDWDLQSTLLRRAIQAGARQLPVTAGDGHGPFLAENDEQMAGFERRLIVSSRTAREDAVGRFALPIVEEVATERLMETSIKPAWLVQLCVVLLIAAAFCFSRGWAPAALGLMILATPLDLIAQRLAILRLKPLAPKMLSRRMIWPMAGLALFALGWFEMRHGSGWGALMAALSAAGFAEAGRVERKGKGVPTDEWLFSWRNAVWLAIPFAIGSWWNIYLGVLSFYAAGSFFIAQHYRHRVERD
nr:hypothetical protein [uncultured Sphingomonas sp.]